MGSLEGKVAFITGGARGQGRSHALALAREGCDIVVCDLESPKLDSVPYDLAAPGQLEETQRLVEELDRRCLAITADTRDRRAMEACVDEALSAFGRLDIHLPNAGIWAASPLAEMTDDQWDRVVDINLTGVFNSMRAAMQPMIEQKSGRIIATASTAARSGMMNFGNYVAAKWGVLGLVKTAALELAPYNITVNAICPGAVSTDMMLGNEALYRIFRPDLENPTTQDVEETIMAVISKLPKPWIEREEISGLVVFLASDAGRSITGTGIDINSGLSATWSA
ncbi:unannotated protein [freshwater metagenome]|uniref:Unannotated protein n=1 Tax=freshwater metagenome TaxID=449393 RepID=A0A6J7DA48_9ZZZZ|nr:mycofactocin-coupled SDR family oxidoreductase [Actinomycetota bacterium]